MNKSRSELETKVIRQGIKIGVSSKQKLFGREQNIVNRQKMMRLGRI